MKISKKVILKNLSRANKMHSNRQPMSVMDLMKKYGGTHFFYAQLITAGKLVKNNGKYVWSGGKLTQKTIKPILRNVAKHRKPINDKYRATTTLRSPENKQENLIIVKPTKMKNITTPSRYADKCVRLQNELHNTNYTITQVCKVFGGSWYFYRELFERGFIKKVGREEYVRWGDKGLPTEKELRKIARRVNTLNRNGHMKLLRKQIGLERLSEAKSEFQTAINEHLANKPVSPAVDLLIAGVEKEIQAHRSNGSNAEHIKNIALISADLMKLVK